MESDNSILLTPRVCGRVTWCSCKCGWRKVGILLTPRVRKYFKGESRFNIIGIPLSMCYPKSMILAAKAKLVHQTCAIDLIN